MVAAVTETVTRIRPTRDRHGDVTSSSELAVDGCVLAPRAGAQDGETAIVGLTLYAPFDADLKHSDQVRISNPAWVGTYDIVGEPGRWQSPFTGAQPGLEVALTRTS